MIGLQVENGIIVNVAIFDKLPNGWVTAPDGVGIGWTDNGDGSFSAPVAEPTPTPDASTCSKLQMLEELASRGQEDALFAALASDVSMQRRYDAASFLAVYNPLVVAMGAALGYDAAGIQALFNAAAVR